MTTFGYINQHKITFRIFFYKCIQKFYEIENSRCQHLMSTLEIAPFLMVRVWQFNSWHNSLCLKFPEVLMEKPKQHIHTQEKVANLCCIGKK